jgi:hypothetical protein
MDTVKYGNNTVWYGSYAGVMQVRYVVGNALLAYYRPVREMKNATF